MARGCTPVWLFRRVQAVVPTKVLAEQDAAASQHPLCLEML